MSEILLVLLAISQAASWIVLATRPTKWEVLRLVREREESIKRLREETAQWGRKAGAQ